MEVGYLLGRGSSGSVYRAKCKDQHVAVKVIICQCSFLSSLFLAHIHCSSTVASIAQLALSTSHSPLLKSVAAAELKFQTWVLVHAWYSSRTAAVQSQTWCGQQLLRFKSCKFLYDMSCAASIPCPCAQLVQQDSMRQRQSHVPINKLAFLVLYGFGDLSISLPRGSGLLLLHALVSLITRRVVTGTRNMWWLHQLT